MKKHLKGSFTLEAAGVMAVILFGIGTIITEAGRIHDQISGAMTVHEAAEKVCHEKNMDLGEAEAFFQRNRGLRLRMKDDRISLRKEGKWICASGRAENWEKEIRLRHFRPETFLRKITLIEKLGEEDEDQLYP